MLDAFLKCPAHMYKQYILGEVDTKKSSALEFGTALHLGIKTILEGGDGEGMFNMYWDSLRDVDMIYYRYGWTELRDLAIQKFLPNFGKLHAKKFTDIKQEETLVMPILLGQPCHPTQTPNNHYLQGTYDLLCQYEGQLTIVDWKTSSSEYKRNKIEKNPQLYIYAALCKHVYGTMPTQIMYKTFIKAEGRIQTMKYELTEQRLSNMMKNVEHIAQAMLNMIETKALYHNHESCYCKEI